LLLPDCCHCHNLRFAHDESHESETHLRDAQNQKKFIVFAMTASVRVAAACYCTSIDNELVF
jgi:hypothetical protein